MPINSASIPALRIARDLRRRKRAEGGGLFDYSGVGEAMPENIGRERMVDPLVTVPKRLLWDLPHEAIDAANRNPLPGLRREDYTDIPPDTSPDPNSPLGSVGISVPRQGAQPVDPMVGASLETAANVAGAPLVGAPVARAGEAVLGAGAIRKAPKGLDEVEKVLEAERALKGASGEPKPAAGTAEAAPLDAGAVGGPSGGGESLQQAAVQAERRAAGRKPVEGLPVGPQLVGGEDFIPGPVGRVHDVADAYMKDKQFGTFAPPDRYHPIDPEHSAAIAKAYDEMKHAPNDPAVKNAYDALIKETLAQYQAIKDSGLKISPVGAADYPYHGNPREVARDIADNNHMAFFKTNEGFGVGEKPDPNHPMLRSSGEKIGDHDLLNNDLFRIVHDYFGHVKNGYGFRAAGEDNAWRAHAAMYSDLARPAMTAETRGQNSWVNYGPHGEFNRTASGADTIYAPQKVGLMPDWTMYDRGKEPIYAYHGSPHSFDRFSMDKIGSGEGAQAYGHGLYFAENPKVAKAYRDQLSAGQAFEMNGEPLPWTHVTDLLMAAAKKEQQLHPDQTYQIVNQFTNMLESGKSAKTIRKNYDAPRGFEKPWNAMLDLVEQNNIKFNKKPGNTYKVAIEADPETFFDLDKPLEKQPEKVRKALAEIDPDSFHPSGADYDPKERGQMIYHRLMKYNRPEASEASRKLAERGIPGLKYYDAGSRKLASGARSHNYVAFDDKIVRILRKYGITGLPAAGAAAGAMQQEERRAAGGRAVRRAVRRRADGGGLSDEDQAAMMPETFVNPAVRHTIANLASLPRRAIESSEAMRRGDGYDPGPILEAATLPMGTGAVAGVPVRGREMVLGSGPVYRMPEEGGAAMEVARAARKHRYAEPEYTESGSHIYNKGVDNPPDPSIQTVADPHRMMYPGIYRNPRIIADEAAARVGPEDPAMKQLFGVTRGDLREMAKGRVGNEEPNLRLAGNPRGSLSAQNIQTPHNTQRLVDILGEAGRHEGLRTADAWYIMDPVYKRMEQMFGPEEAIKRYKMFNTSTAMASPGSDVMAEIQRGTAAHWLNNEGRFGEFMKFSGVPEGMRYRVAGYPGDMKYIGGHPYHRTAQAGPMQKFFDTGAIQSDAPKVPLYAHASGVPETGFQTTGPVGDAHFSRGVGLSDTRKGPTDVQGSFSRGEYQTLQPWWQHDVAGQVGLESVPAQARLWTALGPQTGVESELGAPKLELLAKQIMVAARRLHISPEQARDLILSGKAGAGMLGGAMAAPAVMDAMRGDRRAAGGSVDAAMKVARDIRRARGGGVHVGPIVGKTGGRADEVPMEVPDGSYVLTADHCSAMGEGNTLAGFEKLKKMFPKSVAAYKAAKANRPAGRASGGRVPIYAADGEFVICPEDIKDRFGDLDHGHKVLDHWQTSERKNHIDTLSKLAPPAQD